jgi:5-methylcytosine-specific restriction protein B
MSSSNGYYPVYLFYKKENILVLAYGISETVVPEDTWTYEIHNSSQTISELIYISFRYGDSYVYKHYVPKIENDVVRYFVDEQEVDKKTSLLI